MSNDSLSFSGDQVQFGKSSWKVEFPIREAIVLEDKVILLYDPDSPEAIRFRQFKNLVAYDVHGEKLWTAGTPYERNLCCIRQSYVIQAVESLEFCMLRL